MLSASVEAERPLLSCQHTEYLSLLRYRSSRRMFTCITAFSIEYLDPETNIEWDFRPRLVIVCPDGSGIASTGRPIYGTCGSVRTLPFRKRMTVSSPVDRLT